MVTLLWSIVIMHVITDRLLWPFVRSAFTALTVDVSASASPTLNVAVTEVPVKEPGTKTPAPPLPAAVNDLSEAPVASKRTSRPRKKRALITA